MIIRAQKIRLLLLLIRINANSVINYSLKILLSINPFKRPFWRLLWISNSNYCSLWKYDGLVLLDPQGQEP